MSRQNLCVDKILVSTKIWRRRRRISLLLGSAESAAADFYQATLKISYFSLMVLLSVHAVFKWGIASSCPAFMGGLSLSYCIGLFFWPVMLKMSKTLAPTKYRRPPKIHWFSPNYSSLYLCSQVSYKKVVKTQMLTITVQYQFLHSRPPNQRLS